jgi:secreted trypsin-like serine protease
MRFVHVLCLFVSVSVLSACSREGGEPHSKLEADHGHRSPMASSEEYIVGGTKVRRGDPVAAATVALMQANDWTFCTGTLISNRHVLTAAHCLADFQGAELYVGFGPGALVKSTPSFAKSGAAVERVLASHYVVHGEFDQTAVAQLHPLHAPHDIALVTLSADAPAGFQPMPMLTQQDGLVIGEPLILAGFGLTQAEGGTSGQLRKVKTTLTGVWAEAAEIEFGDSPGKSACNGDSGGPAYVKRSGKYQLIGVTSRGLVGCGGGGIYTDVRSYQQWIAANERA